MTIQEKFENAENPLLTCAGHKVITGDKFEYLAIELSKEYGTFTVEEAMGVLTRLSYKFTACFANLGEKYAVLRKNNINGWDYVLEEFKQ